LDIWDEENLVIVCWFYVKNCIFWTNLFRLLAPFRDPWSSRWRSLNCPWWQLHLRLIGWSI